MITRIAYIVASSIMAWFIHDLPMPLPLITLLFVFIICLNLYKILLPNLNEQIILRIKGVKWTVEDFCRGWLITGATGSGKTRSGIITILKQFLRFPKSGAVCIDQKGLFYQILLKLTESTGRANDLILLKLPESGKEPEFTINLTGDSNIPAGTYAKALVDTALALVPDKGFFPDAARDTMKLAIEILRKLDCPTTIPNIYKLCLYPDDRNEVLEELEKIKDTLDGNRLYTELKNFVNTVQETRQGIEGTIKNYLSPFMNEEVAKVFCNPKPNMNIGVIDDGKIICFTLPTKLLVEKMFINSLFKLNYYMHALSRFDLPNKKLKNCNVITLIADEGQEVLTCAESAFADHRSAGIIREANATVIIATQGYASILAAIEAKYAKVLMQNLTNELIFKQATQESAEMASKNIGERMSFEKSRTRNAGKYSYTKNEKVRPYFEPFQLRELKKYYCIVKHCEGKFKKTLLEPLDDNGKIALWFNN